MDSIQSSTADRPVHPKRLNSHDQVKPEGRPRFEVKWADPKMIGAYGCQDVRGSRVLTLLGMMYDGRSKQIIWVRRIFSSAVLRDGSIGGGCGYCCCCCYSLDTRAGCQPSLSPVTLLERTVRTFQPVPSD